MASLFTSAFEAQPCQKNDKNKGNSTFVPFPMPKIRRHDFMNLGHEESMPVILKTMAPYTKFYLMLRMLSITVLLTSSALELAW